MHYLGYGGISLGSILAIVISFNVNHSILWAIIHGFFGWFYVAYYLLFRK
ncbi:MAG TPA: hypothetical protein LFW14_00275 [Rickettsia endosymbiont of Degeeriella rufa]|nr:hypothetical protein [Rickettsia endosymbiont of Columbicola hoogstraali]HJD62045.1 hypothetical protein [Rickettsia endosymbiont of Degeeriella rufa]